MVICVVVGCSKRSDRDKDFWFYRIPAVSDHQGTEDFDLRKRRRDGYLAAISREDLDYNSLGNYRICSRHFITGKPTSLYETTHPDWLPTLQPGHTKVKAVDTDRYERIKKRNSIQEMEGQLPAIVEAEIEAFVRNEVEALVMKQFDKAKQYFKPPVTTTCEEVELPHKNLVLAEKTIDKLKAELAVAKALTEVSEEYFKSNEFTRFYTGLPNIGMLKATFEHVHKTLPAERSTKLTPFQEFVRTMVKLSVNTPIEDLGYRFRVSTSTVSRILLKWLRQMDIRLKDLIHWPDRDALQKTMPVCFQESFGKKVAIIIDCFEIFIERPSSLEARATTWSNYKYKNTVKVLLGITPQGVILFVSDTWGGRVSDKYLTDHCGILKKLLPGDVVLADRGFDISESVGMMQATLRIPAFTKGKSQLSALEVENTRIIANVCIHIERVVSCVRQKYSILQGTLPIDFLTVRKGESSPQVDRIVCVCCALNNLCNSVVPFE